MKRALLATAAALIVATGPLARAGLSAPPRLPEGRAATVATPPSTSVLPPVGAGASRPLAPAPAGSSPVRTATSVAPPPTQATAVTPAPTTAVSATAPVHAPAATSTTTAPLLPHAVPSTSADQYVRACGVSLCLAGSPWRLYGATIYSGYDDPRGRISMAKAAGLNTLRLVNFIDP